VRHGRQPLLASVPLGGEPALHGALADAEDAGDIGDLVALLDGLE